MTERVTVSEREGGTERGKVKQARERTGKGEREIGDIYGGHVCC